MTEKMMAPSRQVWAAFLFSRILIVVVAPEDYGDVPSYFAAVSRFASKGTPYGEDGFGYPILAFIFVAIPWLFGATKFDVYCPIYRMQCFVLDVLLFHLLSKRCSRVSLLVYIVCTTLLGTLIYHRLDILLGLLLVVVLVLEARDSSRLASLALGVSIAFKVIPLLLVPAWLTWVARRSQRATMEALCLVALGAGAPMAFACLLCGWDALLFMGAHAGRGIQLESTWASIGILLMALGLPGNTYFGAGSYNLSTPLQGAFTMASHVAVLAGALWGAVVSARSRTLTTALVSTLGSLLLLSKVFSPQYFLFFLPLLVLSLDSMTQTIRYVTIALTLACCALTTWVYPYHATELVALEALATLPLGLRNALFALLVVLLEIQAWRSGGLARLNDGGSQ